MFLAAFLWVVVFSIGVSGQSFLLGLAWMENLFEGIVHGIVDRMTGFNRWFLSKLKRYYFSYHFLISSLALFLSCGSSYSSSLFSMGCGLWEFLTECIGEGNHRKRRGGF